MESKIAIEKLTGSNYKAWKFNAKMWKYVEAPDPMAKYSRNHCATRRSRPASIGPEVQDHERDMEKVFAHLREEHSGANPDSDRALEHDNLGQALVNVPDEDLTF